MKEFILDILKRRGLQISLFLILLFLMINSILIIHYRNVLVKENELQDKIHLLNQQLAEVDQNIKLAEIGVRAYLIKQEDRFISPYLTAAGRYNQQLDELKANLKSLGFDITQMSNATMAITGYMKDLRMMYQLSKNGNVDAALKIFDEDRGLAAWQKYYPFIESANQFLQNIQQENENQFHGILSQTLIMIIVIVLLGLPIIISAIRRINKDQKFRKALFNNLSTSNKKYIFNSGEEIDEENEDAIINGLLSNLKHASGFINQISDGNYDISWEGMTDKNKDLNKENIAGELAKMRNQMKKVKKEDEIRIWTTEGLSKFAEIIRNYQNNFKGLSEEIISNLVKYLKAEQGGLFIVNENHDGNKCLELMACYAYERFKHLERKLEPGQGLVGQCYLEKETIYMTKVPEDYVNITSGLGGANPSNLLIVPLKTNEKIEGVIELASLRPFTDFEIAFAERIGESIAAAISTVRTNEQTQILLQQSQEQAEEMRSQEEEMRQNMEELEATQEEMHRKNDEIERLLKKASENEEKLQIQLEQTEALKMEQDALNHARMEEVNEYRSMLMDILNEVPQKIFLKDKDGKMVLANQQVAQTHDLTLNELIGKSDYDFVDKETADDWRRQELEIMRKGSEKYVFEENIGGKRKILESIKKVFYIKPLKQEGLLGIQTDITETEVLKRKIEEFEGRK